MSLEQTDRHPLPNLCFTGKSLTPGRSTTTQLPVLNKPSHNPSKNRNQQVFNMLVSADFSADVMLSPYECLTKTQLLE